ncbi:MAG TPA: glycosyltransferase family 2 protein, partial [Gemmatimonadaceae bacterium]|nr:glycosyltransferase family 2 protein [Gemmatimonadaceae bacterium]
MTRPLLSVICPTYNRPEHIGPLLESVLAQDFDDWECVIAEDCSPARDKVKAICDEYSLKSGGRVRCHLNVENLGYDAGFRLLVELARGRFLFVMGDDDFVAPGAFRAVADAIARYPNLGIILRAYAFFRDTPENIFQINRYYPEETRFPAGPAAIVASYRRLVSMSGLVFDRDLAHSFATNRFDSSLFYQHWLAANILVEKDAVYIPHVLAYFRRGGTPIFGHAKAEQGLYTPGVQPPDTDLKMISSLMAIARAVEEERGVAIADLIHRDYGNYMYPTIAHQAHQPWPVFYAFYRDLGRMGFDKYALFHFWFWSVATLGSRNVDRILQ